MTSLYWGLFHVQSRATPKVSQSESLNSTHVSPQMVFRSGVVLQYVRTMGDLRRIVVCGMKGNATYANTFFNTGLIQNFSFLFTPYFYCCSPTSCYLMKQLVWEIHFFSMADFSAQVPHAFISICAFIKVFISGIHPTVLIVTCFLCRRGCWSLFSNFKVLLSPPSWKWRLVCFSDSESQR